MSSKPHGLRIGERLVPPPSKRGLFLEVGGGADWYLYQLSIATIMLCNK